MCGERMEILDLIDSRRKCAVLFCPMYEPGERMRRAQYLGAWADMWAARCHKREERALEALFCQTDPGAAVQPRAGAAPGRVLADDQRAAPRAA
jgi:hypothetical protein